MGTLKNLLEIAYKQLRVCENPPNSNNVRYNTWYYGHEVSGSYYPWCMVFCQWVYDQAGVKLPVRTASCTTMMDYAKKNKAWVTKGFAPGDLILYDFDSNKYNSEHCGILHHLDGSKYAVIEGNTSTANDTNGGSVMLRTRSASQILGAVRPTFDREEDELDMTKEEFIKSLTDEEAYTLMAKALAYLDKASEPEWSRKDGSWLKATKAGVFDGKRPESFLKRDEAAILANRLGLIK